MNKIRRRDVLKTAATLPVMTLGAKAKTAAPPKPKRVILPPAATKRFQEILDKEGGTITSITVHHTYPFGDRMAYGQSFLFEKEVKGIKIE